MTRRGPSRSFFDLWSLVYDAPWVQRMTYRPEHDAVLRRLHASEPRRVLDVGCGTGRLATRMRRGLDGVEVVGCDFSRGMLTQARSRDAGCRWVRGDAQRLPFAAASFDVVVSTEAFHWFPSQADALDEFFRASQASGAAQPVTLAAKPCWVVTPGNGSMSLLHRRKLTVFSMPFRFAIVFAR